MKHILLYLTIIGLALLEATLFPLHLVLLMIFVWAFVYDERGAIFAAFIGGLAQDIFLFSTLGVHSFANILMAFLLMLILRTRILPNQPLLFGITGVILFSAYDIVLSLLKYHHVLFQFSLLAILGDILIATIVLLLFLMFIGPKEKEAIKLKV